MNKKMTLIKSLALFVALFGAMNFGFGQSIFDNPITGPNPGQISPYTTGQNVDPNITVSGIVRGPGVTGRNAVDRYNTSSWNTPVLDNTAYIEFTLTPDEAFEIDFVNFVYTSQVSDSSIANFAFRSSLDGFTTDIGSPSLLGTTIDLSGTTYQNIASTITFRFYAWGATNVLNAFSINDFTFNGIVSVPPCATTTTWNGSVLGWDNGTPSITSNAVINANYNTATDGGSFSACSLTVNSSGAIPEYSLTVADGDFIKIQNDIVADGNILVQPTGAVVQVNNTSSVTENGNITVVKTTAFLNAWYEYTYWSSPVSGEILDDGLSDSDSERRYIFKAQNYLDATAETANDNAIAAGQDGIDDDGNDWEWVPGTTIMQPGVGYAAPHSEAVFIFPTNYDYSFSGPFNNGIYTIPLYRNNSELNDTNWNFIGNPYPSAIDAQLFLDANINVRTDIVGTSYEGTGYIDGAIYLWSQNTPPSFTENGNQSLNFSSADYAIINGTGQNSGGDGVIPDRFIPSGQGFFVSMSDNAPATLVSGDVYTANVTFSNSMRVTDPSANSKFFKTTNSKNNTTNSNTNKLWVNLTSDNGVFNQTLIGYVNGATNDDDGMYFDAIKNLSTQGAAILYSTIEGSDKVFAIQGKAENSLNEDEVINLGFDTNIDVPTIYTLSVAQLQGDFLTNNPVYLKDNVANTIHNLSASDYAFTSEVGVFKDRFEIVFNSEALSNDTFDANTNTLQITHVSNNQVRFSTSNDTTIKQVRIYDLLGRALYQLDGNSSVETYNLSNLNNSVFIAKVELSNGAIVTKKAIKK